jgi:hypothetical protein
MEAKELRVGNIVYSYSEWHKIECCQVSTIAEILLDRVMFLHGSVCRLKDIKPIKLAEEWLIKFGLEKYDYEDENFEFIYTNNLCKVSLNKDGYYSYWVEEMWNCVVDVEYVHEIQNIFFALNKIDLQLQK